MTFSVIILNAGFTTTLLHSPLMGQKTVPKASRCLRPSLPSLWLSLDLFPFFCLSGTMLTVFSFLLWDQLFLVSSWTLCPLVFCLIVSHDTYFLSELTHSFHFHPTGDPIPAHLPVSVSDFQLLQGFPCGCRHRTKLNRTG